MVCQSEYDSSHKPKELQNCLRYIKPYRYIDDELYRKMGQNIMLCTV